MLKRFLPILTVLVLFCTVSVFASTDAEEEAPDYRSISLFGFNEQVSGAKLDTSSPSAGSGCMQLDYSAGTDHFILPYVFPKPIDISEYDTIEFDLYLSSASFFSMSIREGSLELTSGGVCDVEEISWNWSALSTYIEGEVKEGWNRVILPLPGKMKLNPKALNYFRFYTIGVKGPSKPITVKFDNLRAVKSSAPTKASIDKEMQPVAALVDALPDVAVNAENYASLKPKVEEAKEAFRSMSLPAQETFDTEKYNKLNRLNALIARYEEGEADPDSPSDPKGEETKQTELQNGCSSVMGCAAVLPGFLCLFLRKKKTGVH